MAVNEITSKTILIKHKKIDSWFISQYGMNLYRGCTHNCVYCDGRAEGYYVEGEFGKDVSVKINAPELLNRELDPLRKRVPFKKSFVLLGGGVGDSYQPLENKYGITRSALELLKKYNHPVHVLTKSILVRRDLDLLTEINQKSRVIVSFSFSSVNDGVSTIFEPGVPSPTNRLSAIRDFKAKGLTCGMFLMPVIPFITDTPDMIDVSIKKAREAGVDFIIFGGMTLKDGRQKDYYYNILKSYSPGLISRYASIYPGSPWGMPSDEYYNRLNLRFNEIAKKYNMPRRIPAKFYQDMLSENDLVIVVLEQIDYLLKSEGKKSSFGYAAYSISQLKEPLSTLTGSLQNIKGVNGQVESIIKELLKTGGSGLHRQLMNETKNTS
jgi:DNA repair photolyase